MHSNPTLGLPTEAVHGPEVGHEGLSAEQIQQLHDRGTLYLERPGTERRFFKALRRLGQISLVTPVHILKEPDPPTLYSHRRMFLHTDAPCARYVAWFSVIQGLPGEMTVLLDSRAVLETLGERTRALLCEIRCGLPDRKQAPTRLHLTYEDVPLLRRDDVGDHLNYTPYLHFQTETEEHEKALDAFRRALDAASKNAQHIYLRQGHALIMHNHRFLHCRTELHPDSPRLHFRYWIA